MAHKAKKISDGLYRFGAYIIQINSLMDGSTETWTYPADNSTFKNQNPKRHTSYLTAYKWCKEQANAV